MSNPQDFSSHNSLGLKDPNNNSNTVYPYSNPNNPNKIWLEKVFRKYYFKSFVKIELDELAHQREFGFRLFDGKMYRHLTFKNSKELFAYVLKFSPADIFCSSSVYNNPSAPIEQKQWKGSDLIFDIDGKDLKIECSRIHNFSSCKSCNSLSRGVIRNCLNCNSTGIQTIEIPCVKCFRSLKKEVKKLHVILYEDFGIDYNNIRTYFSGNNGFHVHITDDQYFNITSKKRQAFTQYLLIKDFRLENLGLQKSKDGGIVPLRNKILFNGGWRSRLLKQLKLNVFNHKIDERFIKKLEKIKGGKDSNFLESLYNQVENLSVKIDPSVTMDIHRIFRLAGSINSKSALAKSFCENLDSFDPLLDSCFLDDTEVEIKSKIDVELFLKKKKILVNQGSNIVPEYVAGYLVCKNIADII